MAEFNYTKDQQLALDFPGNVIVSAGAGSGKTRVLVEKYFRLLVDEHPTWPVDSVVAITFTRKAAAELKTRIVKRILKELAIEDLEITRRERLLQLRADVGAAPIGTIHNFCGRILREFAFDAHINPDFAVIEGAQESALRMNAANDAISAATSGTNPEDYNDLLQLLNIVSAASLTNSLASMLAGRTSYMAPARFYLSTTVDELFDELKIFHSKQTAEPRRALAGEWKAVLEHFSSKSAPGKLQDLASTAIAHWPFDPSTDWSSILELLQPVFETALTKAGTCRKADFKAAGIEEFDPIRSALEAVAEKHKKTRLNDLDDIDHQDLEFSRRLAGLFLKAVDRYEALRGGANSEGEAQLVDFADLEILAEKLMQDNARVRQQIRERYRYLILDEFQDTSQQQWNIVKPLCTDESGAARPDCLFVVGDRKQGVYGFREANVTLFSQVQSLISDGNTTWSDCNGTVSMSANFRTSERPLTFINKVFEQLLRSDDNVYSVIFESLTLGKLNGKGHVEFIRAGGDTEDATDDAGKPVTKTAAEKLEDEANLVASHIYQLIEKENTKPGDIAILFRKRSVFSAFENALKKRNIPVVTQQGSNLFHQPELADAVAALNAVAYPHRDLVIVHYFRSPAIGFTDDLLLKISRTTGRSFWDKACKVHSEKQYSLDNHWYPLTDWEYERLSFALGLLQDTRTLVDTVPPFKVVHFLLTQLGALQIAQSSYRGEQAVANLKMLLAMARSAELISFEEFLQYIEDERQSDRGTSEAVDLTATDSVKIMTIHASKGLEFPVVYLPDLNAGVSGRPKSISGDGIQWMTFRLPKDVQTEPSFLFNYFQNVAQNQSEAEEKRIFYVAMTRCKERLVLSANADKRRSANTFYSWIETEFDSAETLYTECDHESFDSVSSSYESPKKSNLNISKNARIEMGLRAATFLSKQNDKAVSNDSRVMSVAQHEFIKKLLPGFLQTLRTEPVNTALSRVVLQIRCVFDEIESAKMLEKLKSISEWMLETFSSNEEAYFDCELQINTPAGIQTFKPTIQSKSKYAWIAFSKEDAEQKYELSRKIEHSYDGNSGAPESIVWLVP